MTNRNYIRLDAAMAMLKSKGVEHWKAIEALLDEKVIINSHEDYLEQIIHHAIELSKCEEAYGSLQTHFSAHRQQFVEREALKARMEARAINDYAAQEEKEKQEKLEEQERLEKEKEERAAELAKLPPIKDSELEQRSATYRRSKKTRKTTTKKTTKKAPANEEDGGTGEE